MEKWIPSNNLAEMSTEDFSQFLKMIDPSDIDLPYSSSGQTLLYILFDSASQFANKCTIRDKLNYYEKAGFLFPFIMKGSVDPFHLCFRDCPITSTTVENKLKIAYSLHNQYKYQKLLPELFNILVKSQLLLNDLLLIIIEYESGGSSEWIDIKKKQLKHRRDKSECSFRPNEEKPKNSTI